ncbi:MAG: EamA family transporter [Acidipila sp.]|nr:EamA family transporter [Acidipila sp.]
MRNTILVFLVTVAGTLGEMSVGRAMKDIGEVTRFTPRAIFRVVLQSMARPFMWLGLLLMAVAFFSLLLLLSWENVSFAVPVTALSYVIAAVGAKFLLREEVSGLRWLGVGMVVVGVSLVWAG